MPARSAPAPKYCLHKPSGRAYVRIRGKVVYVGDYGSADSKQEYGRLVAELAVQPTAALPTARASDLTVVDEVKRKHELQQVAAEKQRLVQRIVPANGPVTSKVRAGFPSRPVITAVPS